MAAPDRNEAGLLSAALDGWTSAGAQLPLQPFISADAVEIKLGLLCFPFLVIFGHSHGVLIESLEIQSNIERCGGFVLSNPG